MATQVIGVQNKATGQEHNPGRFAGLLESARLLMRVYFNTHGSFARIDPNFRSSLTMKGKMECDAYMNRIGIFRVRGLKIDSGEE